MFDLVLIAIFTASAFRVRHALVDDEHALTCSLKSFHMLSLKEALTVFGLNRLNSTAAFSVSRSLDKTLFRKEKSLVKSLCHLFGLIELRCGFTARSTPMHRKHSIGAAC